MTYDCTYAHIKKNQRNAPKKKVMTLSTYAYTHIFKNLYRIELSVLAVRGIYIKVK